MLLRLVLVFLLPLSLSQLSNDVFAIFNGLPVVDVMIDGQNLHKLFQQSRETIRTLENEICRMSSSLIMGSRSDP